MILHITKFAPAIGHLPKKCDVWAVATEPPPHDPHEIDIKVLVGELPMPNGLNELDIGDAPYVCRTYGDVWTVPRDELVPTEVWTALAKWQLTRR